MSVSYVSRSLHVIEVLFNSARFSGGCVRFHITVVVFDFWHLVLVQPAMKRLFCLKAKNGLITTIQAF